MDEMTRRAMLAGIDERDAKIRELEAKVSRLQKLLGAGGWDGLVAERNEARAACVEAHATLAEQVRRFERSGRVAHEAGSVVVSLSALIAKWQEDGE